MDRYTVIYTTSYTSQQKIKQILDTFANKGDMHGSYIIDNISVNIKGNRLAAKDMLKENIKDFTYHINNMGIYANPHEYIGKKIITNDEYTRLIENIKNEKYLIHSNGIKTHPEILMFTDPVKIGSAYGIVKKEHILIFANRLSVIDAIYKSISQTHYNLYEDTVSNIVLCI